MSDETQLPAWVRTLFDQIASAITIIPTDLEGAYAAPDDSEWGMHLLEIAPAVVELTEPAPNQNKLVYGMMQNVDLLTAQDSFEEIRDLSFGLEPDGTPTITIEGIVEQQEIVVRIYAAPFPEEEPEVEAADAESDQ